MFLAKITKTHNKSALSRKMAQKKKMQYWIQHCNYLKSKG